MGSFSYLGSYTRKDSRCNEYRECQGFFFTVEKVWKNRKISMWTKIRILETTLMTIVNYGSEAWVLWNEEGRFTRCFPEKLPTDFFWIFDRHTVFHSRLYEMLDSIPLSRGIIRESLKCIPSADEGRKVAKVYHLS